MRQDALLSLDLLQLANYPMEIITSVELMVENDKKGWGVPIWGEELSNDIKLVLESKNDAAITKSKEFIHRLVAKGYPQCKDLLQLLSRLFS